MTIRSTPGLTTDFAISRLNQTAYRLQQAQEQLSTGKRLHRPSDDPLAVRHSLLQKDRISRLEASIEATQHTRSRLNQAHVELRDAHQLFVRAREIALSASQATDESERKIFAQEAEGLLNQLINITNASDEVGFLFSGTDTRTKPFELDASSSSVTYSGTPYATQLHLAGDADRAALAPGDRIFLSTSRQDTVVVGHTGIGAGPGIDTAVGVLSLEVVHTSTHTHFAVKRYKWHRDLRNDLLGRRTRVYVHVCRYGPAVTRSERRRCLREHHSNYSWFQWQR